MTTTPTPSPEAEALPTLPVVALREEGERLTKERDAATQRVAILEDRWLRASDERDALRAEVAELRKDLTDARKTARQHFLHEHGKELQDAKHWAEWIEAQRMIEEDMPEGYRVILDCSPGDWSLEFCDPEGERIRIDDYESTEDFIRTAVEHAKEHARASLLGDGGTL